MRNRTPPLVMVFLKAPRPGLVKTRLARDLGTAKAVRAYRELAEGQIQRIPANLRAEVQYSPRGSLAEFRQWLGRHQPLRVQSTGDLGRKLTHAFAAGFRRGYSPVLAIGADCPTLDGRCIEEAISSLSDSDVVIGPAADGGYYLIGMNRHQPRLFEGIEWSSPGVLRSTLLRVRECGLSHRPLEQKEDIDDLAGWQRHVGRGGRAKAAPRA